MWVAKGIVAAGVALSMAATAPFTNSATQGHGAAEKIHKLNIMLLVSSLRCRHSDADFQAEYDSFHRDYELELVTANSSIERDYRETLGAEGARIALDRMRVSVANSYGQGHPWLDCGQLKRATSQLLVDERPDALLIAAEELLEAKRIAYDRVELGSDL